MMFSNFIMSLRRWEGEKFYFHLLASLHLTLLAQSGLKPLQYMLSMSVIEV